MFILANISNILISLDFKMKKFWNYKFFVGLLISDRL